jgi:hypothetical protein
MAILSTQYLGQVQGESDGIVAQYLGIQYATVLNRFAEATLVESRDGDVLNATKSGYEKKAQNAICPYHYKVMIDPLT